LVRSATLQRGWEEAQEVAERVEQRLPVEVAEREVGQLLKLPHQHTGSRSVASRLLLVRRHKPDAAQGAAAAAARMGPMPAAVVVAVGAAGVRSRSGLDT